MKKANYLDLTFLKCFIFISFLVLLFTSIFLSCDNLLEARIDDIKDKPEINIKVGEINITSGSNYSFGEFLISSEPKEIIFTIENIGIDDLQLTGNPYVNIDGPDNSFFSVVSQPLSPVDSNGSTNFTIKFTPPSFGKKTANVIIENNDADESKFTFSVEGKVIVILADTDLDDTDAFGWSVSNSTNYIIIGEPNDDDIAEDSGCAYLFYRNHNGLDMWGNSSYFAKIKADDAGVSDQFGCSVSISGDYILTGAYHEDASGNDSGSAYIFYRNEPTPDNWGQLEKLIASDGAADDLFGSSVSISGDYAIVSAPGDDSLKGSAYIFYRNEPDPDNWGQLTKLTASDGVAGDQFGNSVSISGNYVIVGAPAHNSVKGAAYIFYKDHNGLNMWGDGDYLVKLTTSGEATEDCFGYSVSISGDYAVVGAPGDDDKGDESGSAYIFYKNQNGIDNWGELTKVTASDGGMTDLFGMATSIRNNYLIIASQPFPVILTGSAYIFRRNHGGTDNWGEVKRLIAIDGDINDMFSCSVSIWGDCAVVGAAGMDSKGYVYLFPL